MQGRIPILAGGGGRTGYKCVLAETLHGRLSVPFLLPKGDVPKEKKMHEPDEVDFLIKPKSTKTLRATRIPKGIERC